MRQANYGTLEKRLKKKNAELQEVRKFRKKLDDREKEITSEIEKLQNEKIEIIFTQVKKQVRSENLEVHSESIMPLLEALRKNPQIAMAENLSAVETAEVEENK